MPERKRVTLHPVLSDGSSDLDVNLYPKTFLDGIVDREGNEIEVALKKDCVTLDTNQTITGNKSLAPNTQVIFDSEHGKHLVENNRGDISIARVDNSGNYHNVLNISSGGEFHENKETITLYGDLVRYEDNSTATIGDIIKPFKNIYLNGKINENFSGYGLKVPQTWDWNEDKEIATKDEVELNFPKINYVDNNFEDLNLYINAKAGDIFINSVSSGEVRVGILQYIAYNEEEEDYDVRVVLLDTNDNKLLYYNSIDGDWMYTEPKVYGPRLYKHVFQLKDKTTSEIKISLTLINTHKKMYLTINNLFNAIRNGYISLFKIENYGEVTQALQPIVCTALSNDSENVFFYHQRGTLVANDVGAASNLAFENYTVTEVLNN